VAAARWIPKQPGGATLRRASHAGSSSACSCAQPRQACACASAARALRLLSRAHL
jgi:hypothetical protein